MPLLIEVGPSVRCADGAASWQLVVPRGRYVHAKYGVIDNSAARLQTYLDHFRAGVKTQGDPARLPVTINHSDALGAAGWIYDLRLGEQGLEALIDWTEQGREAVASGQFPFLSPDTDPTYQTDQGQLYRDVFAGAALVVRPYYKRLEVELDHQAFSDDAPAPQVLWDEENDPMTEAERAALAAAEAAGQQASDPAAATAAAVTEAQPGALEAGQTVDTQAFADLRAEVEQLRRERRGRLLDDELAAHQFGEQRLAPGPRAALVEALVALDDDQARPILEAVKSLAFYDAGVRCLEGAGATQTYGDEDAVVARQLGLEPAAVAKGA